MPGAALDTRVGMTADSGARWFGPAAVTAVAAIAAGGVGAGLANRGAAHLQDVQLRADLADRVTSTRGGARLIVLEMGTSLAYVHAMLERGRWLRAAPGRVEIVVPSATLQLVASQVSGEEWGYVLVAIADAETTAAQMRERVPTGQVVGRPLGPAEQGRLTQVEAALQQAVQALDGVADPPP